MHSLLKNSFRAFLVGALVALAIPSAFAKGKAKKKDPPPSTSREVVTMASSSQLSTAREKPVYKGAKVSYTIVNRTYEVTPQTQVEINGERSEAAMILNGMVVSVSADRKQSSSPDGEDEYIARTIIAKDAPKPPPTPTPAKKKKK